MSAARNPVEGSSSLMLRVLGGCGWKMRKAPCFSGGVAYRYPEEKAKRSRQCGFL